MKLSPKEGDCILNLFPPKRLAVRAHPAPRESLHRQHLLLQDVEEELLRSEVITVGTESPDRTTDAEGSTINNQNVRI